MHTLKDSHSIASTGLPLQQTVAAAVNAKQSTKWSKLLACLAAAQSKVAEQINAVDQDPEDGSSDHYCSNAEGEEEGSDMDLL